MLDKILGNKTAAIIMLHIYHYGDAYANGIAKDSRLALSPIQNQLERFESAGILVSKMVGRTRLYLFNPKSPITKPFIEIVRIIYDSFSLEDKEQLFKTRRRPRRKGKPVLGRS